MNMYINDKDELFKKALYFHSIKNLLEAEKLYQFLLDQGYRNSSLFINYGALCKQNNQFKKSLDIYTKGIRLYPDNSKIYYNLANLHKLLDDNKKAIYYFKKSIEFNPNNLSYRSNLGTTLLSLGEFEEAESQLRICIKEEPDNPIYNLNLGTVLKGLDRLTEAEFYAKKSLKIKPDLIEGYNNLATISIKKGELIKAKILLIKSLELNHSSLAIYTNLCQVLLDLQDFKLALIYIDKAIEIKNDHAIFHFLKGNILHENNSIKEAIESFQKALEIDQKLIKARWNLSLAQLLTNDFSNGWLNYESRLEMEEFNIHAQPKVPIWKGESLDKDSKLIVISEQGLGDTIHFMRYIPYLRSQGINISFCAQKVLHELIIVSDIHPHPILKEDTNLIKSGKYIPLLSLPKFLNINNFNPLVTTPYISTKSELVDKWKKIIRNDNKKIIGISWQGNPNTEKGILKGRSIPLEKFSRFKKFENLKLVSVQKGFGMEQFKNCSFKNKFADCQNIINQNCDFLDTAAILINCDLVITSDSCVAHLAAALGKPTWVLLKRSASWRFGLHESTFWYPSMRLFHQKELNNWDELITRIIFEIEASEL
ncbi:tetratricopeptide repeat protein [Prochlorococcus marinus]|uniref:tetratricopeptide repeat protein n=1 Tax=Prochlorococcus marinus TaxID=1219 RepID=UPI0022B5A0E6|nr:tetratricopeptide repeat protein [Prochlorococcus marinus]